MPASMRVRERETVTLAEAQWKNKGSYLSLAAADALGPTQPRSTAVLSAATSRFLCPIRLLLGFRFLSLYVKTPYVRPKHNRK